MKNNALKILALSSVFLIQAGCPSSQFPGPTGTVTGGPTIAGGSPAAPPAPPAELPSALVLPESISISVDKTRSGGGVTALEAAALVGPGEFSEQIAFGPNLSYFANQRLNGLLGPLHAIRIPVSPTLAKMDALLIVGSKAYVAHLNFGDFDLDGDGAKEGCSGSTASLPLCVRIWLDDGSHQARLLAARFDAFPTETNPGAGSLRGKDLSFSGPESVIQVAASYDHADPADKFTDSFFGYIDETDPTNPFVPFGIHAFVSQLGPDATALKFTSGASNDGRGLGRWREDQDFWSGSFDGGVGDPRNIRDQCAQISTGSAADALLCGPKGVDIDVGETDYIDFTAVGDLVFNDFPATAP